MTFPKPRCLLPLKQTAKPPFQAAPGLPMSAWQRGGHCDLDHQSCCYLIWGQGAVKKVSRTFQGLSFLLLFLPWSFLPRGRAREREGIPGEQLRATCVANTALWRDCQGARSHISDSDTASARAHTADKLHSAYRVVSLLLAAHPKSSFGMRPRSK